MRKGSLVSSSEISHLVAGLGKLSEYLRVNVSLLGGELGMVRGTLGWIAPAGDAPGRSGCTPLEGLCVAAPRVGIYRCDGA